MRKFRAALLVAFLVAGFVAVERMQTQAVVSPACAALTPDDWFLWWWYSCGEPSTGGGGSGAG
jgi:hypothetical protein